MAIRIENVTTLDYNKPDANGRATPIRNIKFIDDTGEVLFAVRKNSDGTVSVSSDVANAEVELDVVGTGTQNIELVIDDESTGSFQPIAADLTLDAAAGTSEVGDSAYKAPVMGNILGSALTKTKNIIAGIIGKYSIESTNASTYPKAGVIGEIGDATTTADGAFVAVLGGDSAVTNARAAYTVDNQNSTPSSAFEYGLDAQGVDHDSYGLTEYSKAALRLDNNVVVMTGAGAPVDGTTGDNYAGPGSFYIDITNKNAYIQTSAISTPVWKLVVRES
jgi:hypothetical protein